MKITKQARRGAKELFRLCLKNGQLEEARVREVVRRVIAEKPRGYLAILNHFQRLVKLELQRRSARVESAVPLSPEIQAGVLSALSTKYGVGLNTEFVHNPKLIGGLRVQVGSDVMDGSIAARLRMLEESF
jgi:F-type H+-transporting ATPase subunit delta